MLKYLKPVSFAALVVLTMFVSGCSKDKIDRMLTFYVQDEREFEIKQEELDSVLVSVQEMMDIDEALKTGISLPIPPYEVTSSAQSEFETNGTTANLVKDVRLEKLTLELLEPAGEDLSFLKSIELRLTAPDGEQLVLAKLDEIPPNVGNYIELEPSTEKVDKFLKSDKYTVSTNIVIDEMITTGLKCNTLFRFKVKADPL